MRDVTAPVVVGVDGTPESEGALRYAATEARRRRVSLHVVHVVPGHVPMAPMYPYIPEQFEATSRSVLRGVRARVRGFDATLPVTTELTTGSRVAELAAAAQRGQLLALGLETVSGVARLISSTTTASVAARSVVPVVAVPADWQPTAEPGPVVVGVKGARLQPALLAVAFSRAEQLGTSLRVVRAWSVDGPYADDIVEHEHVSGWIACAAERLEKDLQPWQEAHPRVPVETRFCHDHPAGALLDASADAAEVMLARHHAGGLGAHLGSTVRALLQYAAAPVAVVPVAHDDASAEPELLLECSGAALK